jgi:hypothetical protein
VPVAANILARKGFQGSFIFGAARHSLIHLDRVLRALDKNQLVRRGASEDIHQGKT